MNPRSLLSLLFHAEKALDLLQTALDLGILDRLDAGPVGLRALCDATGARPLRMYKFLDGLESLGLVERRQPEDALESAVYVVPSPVAEAARAVLGPTSIERDRNRYPWREVHGRLPSVLRGEHSAPFEWPPATPDAVAAFEASMAAGCAPIVEAFAAHAATLFGERREVRWLDVGGGDGTLAASLLARAPHVKADVYNIPSAEHLVRRRAVESVAPSRLGFVGGDFLNGPLPDGYDVISFVRVLHDWPAEVARALVEKAHAALRPGGTLVVTEEFRTSERLAVQFFWTYFLVGADSCVSRLREVEWYVETMRAVGFDGPRLLPGPFELVVARKKS
jgi:SAM-dependent methyltransferase